MGVRSLTVWRRARKIHSRRVAPRPVSDLISACGLHQPPHKTTKFSAWPVTFLAEGDGLGGVPSSETRVYRWCVQVNASSILYPNRGSRLSQRMDGSWSLPDISTKATTVRIFQTILPWAASCARQTIGERFRADGVTSSNGSMTTLRVKGESRLPVTRRPIATEVTMSLRGGPALRNWPSPCKCLRYSIIQNLS